MDKNVISIFILKQRASLILKFINLLVPIIFEPSKLFGVQYLLKQIGKRACVDNVHPHRFRRTFATDLLGRGMRIEEVMVLMGHVKVETTLIYCSIKQNNIRESYRKYAA